MTTLTRVQLGTMGEALAVDHLTRMGLRILHRNWRCRYGELDVIASDEASRTVVFVEVKTRTATDMAGWRMRSPRGRSGGCAGWPAYGWPVRTSVGRSCGST
jgi:hypothetical protein